MGYISMDEIKTIIEYCPLVRCYGNPGTEKPLGKCHAFRDNTGEIIDACQMCKACSTYEDNTDNDCLEDRTLDIHYLSTERSYYSWLENDGTSNEYETEVRLVPMCSCGYVFTDGICVENHYTYSHDQDIWYKSMRAIHPNICPKCERKINDIKSFGIVQEGNNEASSNRYKRVKHF